MPPLKKAQETLQLAIKKSSATSKQSSSKRGSSSREKAFSDAFSRLPPIDNSETVAGEGLIDAPPEFTKYSERYVGFMDILGFKNLIYSSSQDNPEQHEEALAIFSALDIDFERIAQDFSSLVGATTEDVDLRVHTFSDFVVASVKVSDAGLAMLTFVLWRISCSWLMGRYLSRGAITKGKVIHRDGRDAKSRAMVFGPAFVEAYQIESTVAKFPRILLSAKVRRDWRANKDAPALRAVKQLMHRCEDGQDCIDIFAHLRSSGFHMVSKDNRDEAELFCEALKFHMAAHEPVVYEKTKWLSEIFKHAINGTQYADLASRIDA